MFYTGALLQVVFPLQQQSPVLEPAGSLPKSQPAATTGGFFQGKNTIPPKSRA